MRRIALITLLTLPLSTVEAGGLSSIWDEMLSASSGINQYSGARRNGISLGSASVRIKTVNEQVLAARAPYLQASCKGIDFFGGSLSLIKREELVQMARSIAAAAPMYAFQLAMGMLCPDCNAILADLAKRLNSLNEYISKDCEEWVDLAEKEAPSLQVKSDRKMWQNYSESSSSWFDSKASARAEVSAINSHSKAANMTNTTSKSQYNSVYQAFMDGGVTMPLLSSDKTVVAQMIMSVFGTNIYKFDSSLTASETDGSDAINTSIAPQIRLRGNRLANHTYCLKFQGNKLSILGSGLHSSSRQTMM
ncbi:conjugal transfer protein TraH [Shewanella sp. SM101]|uniref:conjugal transfer protein TraH n=1 Tax=Shewanella sp. SM101 TaxID=2912789 RepID=UPI0021DB31D1|nr:conjugal transfer protein TraH [Shewanella sp. SM101]MCU8106913.1 conjugal transfer protein TraH [Shewanella sp. SM101]